MKNREVTIMMKGIQHDFSEEGIEHRYVGNYTKIADSHIIKYNEYPEGSNMSQAVNENLLKIKNNTIQIRKKGVINTQMYFEQAKTHHGIYKTPFGNFDMTIQTETVAIQETEDSLDIQILYHLSLNHDLASNCTIHIQIDGLREV